MGSIKLPHSPSGNSMSIAAPATNPASDLELKLPATVGTAGQVLSVDGSGNLVWTDNTPMWSVKTGSNQTISNGTNTVVALTSEFFDTDNAFNTSTYTFTVPAGKGGKYWLYHQVRLNSNPDEGEALEGFITKNGTMIDTSFAQHFSGSDDDSTMAKQGWVEDLAAGDALQQKVWQGSGGDATLDDKFTFFGGYRLIGG